MKGFSFDDLSYSLQRFNQLNRQHKSVDCGQNAKTSQCPKVISSLITEDKADSFLGLLKSRHGVCTNYLPKNISLPAAKDVKSILNFVDDGHISIISKCANLSTASINENGLKYIYYLQKTHSAYEKLQLQYVKTQLHLNNKTPCAVFEIAETKKSCEELQKCAGIDTIENQVQQVDSDKKTILSLQKELNRIKRSCRSADCIKYQQNLKMVVAQIAKRNPWFEDESFLNENSRASTKDQLLAYHKQQSANQMKFINNSKLYLNCLSGKQTCNQEDLRKFFEFLPETPQPLSRDQKTNIFRKYLEAQACIEEGTNDRIRTNRVLTSAARDAGLTVATLGLGSIPALAKAGLTARGAMQLRIAGESIDLSANAYFAIKDFKTAYDSCLKDPKLNFSQTNSQCSKANNQFVKNKINDSCAVDSSLSLLAALPLGFQFMQIAKIKIPSSRASQFSQQTILANSQLNNTQRILEYEKLLKLRRGTLLNDPAKARAIIEAHNMPGKIGELTFSQIRSRVRHLKAAGYTSDEIRVGLDAGIFGNPSAAIKTVPKLSPNIERSIGTYVNADLRSAKVVSTVSDTKNADTANTHGFNGDNNAGIEVLELNGKRLFAKIKFPPTQENLSAGQLKELEERFLNEVDYVKRLSDLGLGPKFHGVHKGADGKYRIVTDFVDGFEVHLGETPENLSRLSFATINDITEKSKKLVAAGIDPLDLQFRVDKTGKAHVIDPEYFGKLDGADRTSIMRDLDGDILDLRWDKLKSQTLPRTYQITPDQAETTIRFSGQKDYAAAVAQGKVTSLDTLASAGGKPQGSYNYVVYEDGSMNLARVDNEWQFGVSHRQLANGKKVVGMGEVKIDANRGAQFNVSPKIFEGNTISNGGKSNTQAITKIIEQKLTSNGFSSSKVDFNQVLAPSRKPSYSELVKYCAQSHFKTSNEVLCKQLDQL